MGDGERVVFKLTLSTQTKRKEVGCGMDGNGTLLSFKR